MDLPCKLFERTSWLFRRLIPDRQGVDLANSIPISDGHNFPGYYLRHLPYVDRLEGLHDLFTR